MDRAAAYLAEVHAQVSARKVLGEVLALNRDVHALLRSGRQRLRQTRRLLQVHSRLMAHATPIGSPLGSPPHERRPSQNSDLARPAGFEPGSRCLERSCSVRLTHTPTKVT